MLDAYGYSYPVVVVFGIFGNILVILSILRQKMNLLKNNYYFLVLHLAICDVAALIMHFLDFVDVFWLEQPLSDHSPMIICNVYIIGDAFEYAGTRMMLMISLLRYRAIVHPLKPAISRRKLKVVCGLVYLVGLIVGCGMRLPRCFLMSKAVYVAYLKFYHAFLIFFFFFFPTIFMSVVYYKISRSLIKQNKYVKRVCSNTMRRGGPDFFNILRYIRNRRTFLVCLSTVLCYGIACIPASVWRMWFIAGENHLVMKYFWVRYFAFVLGAVGSHSINPVIYMVYWTSNWWHFGNVAARRSEKHRKVRQLLSYLEKRELLIDCMLYKRTIVLSEWHMYIFTVCRNYFVRNRKGQTYLMTWVIN